MATAQARIFKTTTPNGFSYTFDRTDTSDGSIDNAATAANAGAALDAVKALIGGLPGVFASAVINISTFE
jgi:hypothetical protein